MRKIFARSCSARRRMDRVTPGRRSRKKSIPEHKCFSSAPSCGRSTAIQCHNARPGSGSRAIQWDQIIMHMRALPNIPPEDAKQFSNI